MSLRDRLTSQLKTTLDNEIISKFEEAVKNPDESKLEIEGLGILDSFFVDDNLNSIYVSGAKNVYIEKRGAVHKSTTTFRDNIQLINIIKKNALDSGIEYDENTPYIKFNYQKGVNVRAVLPPLSNVPVLFVKNYCDEIANTKVFQENQIISKELAMVFETFASMKINILIAGTAQSLKTSVLSAIAKLVPAKNKGVMADFKNEITINSDNFVSYDFLGLNDEKIKEELTASIFASNPDKVAVNDCDDKMFYQMLNYASCGFKGLLTTINASDTEDAVNNVAQILLKYNPAMNFEEAKRSVYRIFDIIIFVNKDENGLRTVSKISETDFAENKINDIFFLNENNEHSSTGFVPKFYTLSNSLSINPNIFDENYKHTYSKSASSGFQPSGDIIKKIKESVSSDNFENISKSLSSDEMLKKAQEKFEELKRNANLSEFQSEPQNEEVPQDTLNSEFSPNE